MIINETEMLNLLDTKNVVLVEPNYKRKYPPLGLAKISTYVKQHGGNPRFVMGNQYIPQDTNLYCVSSLFTYNTKEVKEVFRKIRFLNPQADILLGGIAASLVTKEFDKQEKVYIFSGTSHTLDLCVPDYSHEYQIEEPWDKYSFTFTSRGCPNRCAYCAVWRLEPKCEITENWRDHILEDKPFAMISDNNFSSQPMEHIVAVTNFLKEKKKKVVFDNGFDCKHIDENFAKLVSGIKYVRSGCRVAFDRIEESGIFQDAVKRLINYGVSPSSIMAYVLFNFTDTPQEANYRMTECVKMKIRPYPQQYTPLNHIDKKQKFIGKYWTPGLLRAFRFFWLMAGYYAKYDFVTWVKNQTKYSLTQEDWDAWYGKTV
jgi:hypothetical protein